MNYDHIWDSLNKDLIPFLEKNFQSIAPKLIQFLIASLLSRDEIEIGTFNHGKRKGSMVSYDVYDTHKALALKLDQKDLIIEVSIYDSDLNDRVFSYTLTQKEVAFIPTGLLNLMKKTIQADKPMVVSRDSIDT